MSKKNNIFQRIFSKIIIFFLFPSIIILLLLNILSFSPMHERDINNANLFPQEYKIVNPPLPENPEFCGERVPIENFEVYERLEREMIVGTYWHSSTLLYLKRINRWFPVIEPILEENGIPDDFKYLAVIESGLDNVVSPKGATGFWQFMEEAGVKYGLEISDEVDERYNIEKSTEAACKYLLDSHEKFGSWTMAAVSYNFGVEGLEKQIERQKSNIYYNLVFGEETTRYILRLIAAKEVLTNPEKYGFYLEDEDLYEPLLTYNIEINSPINHLADFAMEFGINYKILKYFNPWLRENFLSNSVGKSYLIKLPVAGSIEVIPDTYKNNEKE